MVSTPGSSRRPSGGGDGRRTGGRRFTWGYVAGALLLAGVGTGVFFALSPTRAAQSAPARAGLGSPSDNMSGLKGKHGAGAAVPMVTAMAHGTPTSQPRRQRSPAVSVEPAVSGAFDGGAVPRAGANFAGSLMLDAAGAKLAAWNQTSAVCSQSWELPNGRVSTDASGDVNLLVNGKPGSCVGLVSPQAFSSGVIEAELYLPGLPGKPNTIANWTSFWMTDSAHWPTDGELDAVEVEPVDGDNDVTWHSGSAKDEFSASTNFATTTLPQNAPDLTPGWHTVDVVYTKGFFAVYYDGSQYTSYTSGNVTGDPLNLFITTSVAANDSTVQGEIGGPPVNSDSSPATYGVKYVKVWSFK